VGEVSRNYIISLPFLISLLGVITDYLTTTIGLNLGFYETHPKYHPVFALAIFWGGLSLLTLILPRKRFWEMSKNIFASASFLGAVNNTLVILGVSSGLVIMAS
jgi:hypothetical protein